MSKLLKELLNLTEERDKSLQYTEKKVKGQIDRVIVELTGNQSGRFTKLVKQYIDVKEDLDALETVRLALNETIKEEMIPLFNATDEVYTRVVDTVGASLNLSKRVKATTKETTDYEKIYEGMVALVDEDLKKKLEELKKSFTSIANVNEKSPALRVDIKEGMIKTVVSFIKDVTRKFTSGLTKWTSSYDRKLDKLRMMIEELGTANVVTEAADTPKPDFKSKDGKIEMYMDFDDREGQFYCYGAKNAEEAETLVLDHIKEVDKFFAKHDLSIMDCVSTDEGSYDADEDVFVDYVTF